ncbi:MAG TPA: cytochrome-c peroxidase, partial [Polyangiaceae bacterium]
MTLSVAGALGVFVASNRLVPSPWNDQQRAALRSLWIGELPPVPEDPSNRFADDPRAARLGARLFRDPRLSGNGALACASCHKPELAFSDGLVVAHGIEDGTRNTPSIVPAAYSPTYFWDGRRDSQWAQALSPLENARELGSTRTAVFAVVQQHYRTEFEEIFGPLTPVSAERLARPGSPLGDEAARAAWRALSAEEQKAVNRAFANVGKALAAYQRTLAFEPSRFDRYVSHVLRGNHLIANVLLNAEERAGLELFIGKANCTLCHRGPLFTGHEFFALGLPFGSSGPDPGRGAAAQLLLQDPFNCIGDYSDAKRETCWELRFLSE